MAKNKIFLWIVVGIMAISLVGLTGVFSLGPSPSQTSNQSNGSEQRTSGVPCLTSEVFHIHPQLTISVDGKGESLPANLGILPGCTRELHTHAADAADGIIHVESAVDRGYVLTDFLSVWGKTLVREGYTLKMTVDGKETTDPNFVMKDGQKIILKYSLNSQ